MVLTEYVPSFVNVSEVFVHAGAVSPESHNRTELALIVALPDAVSFARGKPTSTLPCGPAIESARAVGGANVVNAMVLLDFAPRLSVTEYLTVDVPVKLASPTNVTTPVEVFTV